MKNKIDINKWKEFKISDLFVAKNTGNILARDIVDGSGNTPYVTASGVNNGVVAYINAKDYEIIEGNCILIGGKTFTLTYQAHDFVSNDSHNFELRIKDYCIGMYEYLYLIAVLTSTFKNKFFWGDAVTKSKMLQERILLPVDSDDNPDWQYMKEYMKNIEEQSRKSIKELNSCSEEINKVNITQWGEFKIGNIFEIVSPKVYHTREVKENSKGIPYVVRSKFNNGIKYMVEKDKRFIVNPKGVISFGAENASFFYQEKEYISGRDMYYIDTRNLSRNTVLFIIACLEKLTSKYSYNFGLFPKLLKEEKIKLPITNNGEPDYEYMDKYMSEVLNKTKNKLNCLAAI